MVVDLAKSRIMQSSVMTHSMVRHDARTRNSSREQLALVRRDAPYGAS